mmetsp:Transcript_11764/g.38669  ORF Transcript_11764/g.38669 Transcript_11764/m.38669 type:complete len:204 (-) Transcript_11764:786-1397(-)
MGRHDRGAAGRCAGVLRLAGRVRRAAVPRERCGGPARAGRSARRRLRGGGRAVPCARGVHGDVPRDQQRGMGAAGTAGGGVREGGFPARVVFSGARRRCGARPTDRPLGRAARSAVLHARSARQSLPVACARGRRQGARERRERPRADPRARGSRGGGARDAQRAPAQRHRGCGGGAASAVGGQGGAQPPPPPRSRPAQPPRR